jgi:hypothetical protein
MENLGGYTRIFPPADEELYQLYNSFLSGAKNYMMDMKVARPKLSHLT